MVLANSTVIELDMGKLEDLLKRIDAQDLHAEDYGTLHSVIESYVGLFFAVGDKNTTIARLRKMLFGMKTEKTAKVVGQRPAESAPGPAIAASPASDASPSQGMSPASATSAAAPEVKIDSQATEPVRAKGHGHNGADAYTAAEKIEVPHSSFQPGDPCPQCAEGTLYDTGRPGVVMRLVGQPPVGGKVYYLQKLRCGLCGVVITADLPAGVDAEGKRDATVGSMIALLKYGMGMPFNRNETFQQDVGVPLPAATQWDIVAAQAEHAEPVFDEMARQAAQGDVVYNDDTTVRILAMMGRQAPAASARRPPARHAPWRSHCRATLLRTTWPRGRAASRRRPRRKRSPARGCSRRASFRKPGMEIRLSCF